MVTRRTLGESTAGAVARPDVQQAKKRASLPIDGRLRLFSVRTKNILTESGQIPHFTPSRKMRGDRIEVIEWNELPDWLFQPSVV